MYKLDSHSWLQIRERERARSKAHSTYTIVNAIAIFIEFEIKKFTRGVSLTSMAI